jgi:hypothetical protein
MHSDENNINISIVITLVYLFHFFPNIKSLFIYLFNLFNNHFLM